MKLIQIEYGMTIANIPLHRTDLDDYSIHPDALYEDGSSQYFYIKHNIYDNDEYILDIDKKIGQVNICDFSKIRAFVNHENDFFEDTFYQAAKEIVRNYESLTIFD